MRLPHFLTLLALLLGLGSCSPTPPPAQWPPAPTAAASQWAKETHRQLNLYRREKGLTSLRHHPGLDQLSLNHSDWLLRKRGSSFMHGSNVSHSGSGYRAKFSRTHYNMIAWGENVAYISGTPEDVAGKLITMWKASPPHNKAMLGNWTDAGIGICVDEDGAIFATMNFGRQKAD